MSMSSLASSASSQSGSDISSEVMAVPQTQSCSITPPLQESSGVLQSPIDFVYSNTKFEDQSGIHTPITSPNNFYAAQFPSPPQLSRSQTTYGSSTFSSPACMPTMSTDSYSLPNTPELLTPLTGGFDFQPFPYINTAPQSLGGLRPALQQVYTDSNSKLESESFASDPFWVGASPPPPFPTATMNPSKATLPPQMPQDVVGHEEAYLSHNETFTQPSGLMGLGFMLPTGQDLCSDMMFGNMQSSGAVL